MVAGFTLFIEAEVHALRDRLSGNLRQRVRHTITNLASDPFPPHSRLLDTNHLDLPTDVTIRRVRLEQWRLIYAVHSTER
jgi:mRNA-degrading endonuclease RelE of RelBE toxin-antitoxin system